MDERGQVLPLVALALAAMAGVAGLVARVGGADVARERAATAADAAALAGAAGGGAQEAARLAAANGGRVLRYESAGPQVRVTAEVGGATATARARRGTPTGGARAAAPPPASDPAPGTSGATAAGLAPAMRTALDRAAAALGAPVPIVSGFRSHDQQAWLWSHRATNPYPVAPPGRSAHERGTAVDVPLWFVGRLLGVAGPAGLCQPYARTDPVHFEVCAGG